MSILKMASASAVDRAQGAAVDDLRASLKAISDAIGARAKPEHIKSLIDAHNRDYNLWASQYPKIAQHYSPLEPEFERGFFGDALRQIPGVGGMLGERKITGVKPLPGKPPLTPSPNLGAGRPSAPAPSAPSAPPAEYKGAKFTGEYDSVGNAIYIHPKLGRVALPWPPR